RMVRSPRTARPQCDSHLFHALPRRGAAFKKQPFEQLLDAVLRTARRRKLIRLRPQVAGDSTGLEAGHTSHYFRSRRGPKQFWYPRWPKLTACADIDTHFILAATVTIGPSRDTL